MEPEKDMGILSKAERSVARERRGEQLNNWNT